MKKQFDIGKTFSLVFIGYIVVLAVFYALAGSQLHWRGAEMDNIEINDAVGPISNQVSVEHTMICSLDIVNEIGIPVAAMGGGNIGTMFISITDNSTGMLLCERAVNIADIWQDHVTRLNVCGSVSNVRGHELSILFTSDAAPDDGIALYSDHTPHESQKVSVNGGEIPGVISVKLYGANYVPFLRNFLTFAVVTLCILAACLIYLYICHIKGRSSYGLAILSALDRYRFLLTQLVARDFKTKYKRSILGILWSFLNPLMMMVVQYLVFSNIFRSDINNFPVYLLIGTVFFSFFSEGCSFGIGAITDNAALITKVYIPKYIFPLSKVLSSGINLLLSLIPLLAVVAITKTPITPLYLLLVYPILLIILLTMGMSMFLSAIMVFFRDTRFIWGVVIMIWMYLTPIFYPESIIPSNLQFVIKLNPVYHIIRFARIVILEGVSPIPQAYLYSGLTAVAFLFFGALVFKFIQKKFILHL
jgi:ABC-2 type transport system permease protein